MALGPLERGSDGFWGLGDRERNPSGRHVVLLPEGFEQRHDGVRQALVPWSRFMTIHEVGPRFEGRHRIGPVVRATLRDPYEVWEARFTRHAHRYRTAHVLLLDELFVQTAEAKETARLGDPDWPAAVVERLAPQSPWTRKALRSAVAEAREA
ncbi:hypothetical protein [Streptomyces cinereoruber]|uniref:hypothetical protein n=1 Tax=Streptomyces cinereoruber TaxID=67260 RepID=UPI00362C7EFE